MFFGEKKPCRFNINKKSRASNNFQRVRSMNWSYSQYSPAVLLGNIVYNVNSAVLAGYIGYNFNSAVLAGYIGYNFNSAVLAGYIGYNFNSAVLAGYIVYNFNSAVLAGYIGYNFNSIPVCNIICVAWELWSQSHTIVRCSSLYSQQTGMYSRAFKNQQNLADQLPKNNLSSVSASIYIRSRITQLYGKLFSICWHTVHTVP